MASGDRTRASRCTADWSPDSAPATSSNASASSTSTPRCSSTVSCRYARNEDQRVVPSLWCSHTSHSSPGPGPPTGTSSEQLAFKPRAMASASCIGR